jgi:hypothetical protein
MAQKKAQKMAQRMAQRMAQKKAGEKAREEKALGPRRGLAAPRHADTAAINLKG